MNTLTRSRLLACVPALLAPLVGGGAVVGGVDRLPLTVATHFRLDGSPDGFADRNLFCWSLLTLAVTAAVLALAAAWGLEARSARGMWLWGLTYLSWIPITILIWTLIAHGGVMDPEQVRGPGFVGLVLVIGWPLLVATLVARYSGGVPDRHQERGVPSLGLAAGELAMWQRTTKVIWPWLLAGLGLCAAVGGFWTGTPVVPYVGLLVALVGFVTSSLTTTVDQRGLIVAWGPLRWPQIRIGLAEVEAARAEQIKPMSWGGWGYRGSLRLFGKAAAVLRSGSAIVVDLTGGRTFAVTVDDATTGAALLNDLAARAGAEQHSI